jgi:hypothetical protein
MFLDLTAILGSYPPQAYAIDSLQLWLGWRLTRLSSNCLVPLSKSLCPTSDADKAYTRHN